ncbi:MAG: hypothetical protein HYS23_03720 [Geobacter sp.]|nr:hypothetical protein [Geobacter sp.]
MTEETDIRRPLGLTLLTGLYLFFFLVTISTYGKPLPFMGRIYDDGPAKIIIFLDSLVCLYLFLGILKRQYLTWYLVIGYNLFEIANTVINLNYIHVAEVEKVIGERVNQEAMIVNNIVCALAILLLTQFVYKNKSYFSNRQKYLF